MDGRPCLKALTPEANMAIGGSCYPISHVPFRVGRESRAKDRANAAQDVRRRPDASPNNDLYLLESGPELNVSREHFLIDLRNGEYVLVDRGSACGTLVEGELVGGKRQADWRRLEGHDVIIVGTSESRYVFKFVLLPPETPAEKE